MWPHHSGPCFQTPYRTRLPPGPYRNWKNCGNRRQLRNNLVKLFTEAALEKETCWTTPNETHNTHSLLLVRNPYPKMKPWGPQWFLVGDIAWYSFYRQVAMKNHCGFNQFLAFCQGHSSLALERSGIRMLLLLAWTFPQCQVNRDRNLGSSWKLWLRKNACSIATSNFETWKVRTHVQISFHGKPIMWDTCEPLEEACQGSHQRSRRQPQHKGVGKGCQYNMSQEMPRGNLWLKFPAWDVPLAVISLYP